MSNLITYGYIGPEIGEWRTANLKEFKLLKSAAKIACNFWNAHVTPSTNIVLQLGVFTDTETRSVARAFMPFEQDNAKYGKILFNTAQIKNDKTFIATVLIHEIGHTLGFGWEPLANLYDKTTGKFNPTVVARIPELSKWRIELDYGPGTQYHHWDEKKHGKELMTGLLSSWGREYVSPITIKMMRLLGHSVSKKQMPKKDIKLDDTYMKKLRKMKFTRQAEVQAIDVGIKKDTPEYESVSIKAGVIRQLLSWLRRTLNM